MVNDNKSRYLTKEDKQFLINYLMDLSNWFVNDSKDDISKLLIFFFGVVAILTFEYQFYGVYSPITQISFLLFFSVIAVLFWSSLKEQHGDIGDKYHEYAEELLMELYPHNRKYLIESVETEIKKKKSSRRIKEFLIKK